MAILKVIFIILEVLVLFNLLIFVHELGHFLAARWRGLKVDRFAIWFGKPIWKAKINGVEYALGWIPAGGYVALPQMASMEMIEGKSETEVTTHYGASVWTTTEGIEGKNDTPVEQLPNVSALDKIIVAFAGPLFSFLLALAFAGIVMVVGRPVSEAETTTTVGYVEKDGPAGKVGLRPGDRILEVDNKVVTKWGGMGDSVMWRIVRSEGATLQVKVERDGKILEFFPVPAKDPTKAWERKSLRQIKIAPAQSALIAAVALGSPAARAGLKQGDQIVEVGGVKLTHYVGMADYIEEHPNEDIKLLIERTNRQFAVSLRPEKTVSPPDEKPRVGIVWDANGKMKLTYPRATEQVRASVNAMVETFGALFARKSDIKPQHLGGAVKIMDVYYRLFSSEEGWRMALWFSVLMNVNLALLNMLPIPVLDGGHILLCLLEAVRRKPISHRAANIIQTSCAVALIAFMLYIAFFDVQELPWKRNKEKGPIEMKFAPKEPTKN